MCGGVMVGAGDLIVADEDGVVVIPAQNIDEVVQLTNHRASQENLVLKELQQGSRIREVWDKYHVL
jgi:4-hydroxy-4-methyl-2-oxoglutarate aldolase